jgi:glycosyltransferase involved in cell wall biosynthesis
MRVVIAGDGENEGELRGNYGSEQIVLLGWQSYVETVQRMAAADVVVVPSLCEESCATVILEGLALGKRVLALARGGTPELIKFQRYPGQLSLFGGIGELVEGLVLLESKEATFQAPESGFPGDVLAVCHDIVRMYTANCAGRSLQCH